MPHRFTGSVPRYLHPQVVSAIGCIKEGCATRHLAGRSLAAGLAGIAVTEQGPVARQEPGHQQVHGDRRNHGSQDQCTQDGVPTFRQGRQNHQAHGDQREDGQPGDDGPDMDGGGCKTGPAGLGALAVRVRSLFNANSNCLVAFGKKRLALISAKVQLISWRMVEFGHGLEH
jgi:hypothetical protein